MIDAATDELIATVDLGSGVFVVEPVGAEIWVLDFDGTEVIRVDPDRGG